MKRRTCALAVVGLIVILGISANRPAYAGIGGVARAAARCTIISRTPSYPQDRLVALVSPTPDTARAPSTPDRDSDFVSKSQRAAGERAWRFRIEEVPRFVADRQREILKRAGKMIWVVPWARGAMCGMFPASPGHATSKGLHAVLFLSLRPESLWVRGEPTFNSFDDFLPPRQFWESDSAGANQITLRDLRIFLALYPRLAGVTPWREGSGYDWALQHRDSAAAPTVRDHFRTEASERLTNAVVKAGSPLIGVWRGTGTLTNGDSLHFWMQLHGAPRLPSWGGNNYWYEGSAPIDSIPPPMQYAMLVRYARTRDSLPADTSNSLQMISVPLAPLRPITSAIVWPWLGRFSPASRQAEFYRNDSIVQRLIQPTAPPYPLYQIAQVITLNASRDSLFSEIKIRDSLIGHWVAHRVP